MTVAVGLSTILTSPVAVEPVDQTTAPPRQPVAVNVTAWPGVMLRLEAVRVRAGTAATITVAEPITLLMSSLQVTAYPVVMVGLTTILAVDAPVLHSTTSAPHPEAVKVTDCPAHRFAPDATTSRMGGTNPIRKRAVAVQDGPTLQVTE